MYMLIFRNGIFSLILCPVLQFLNSFNLKANAKLHVLGVSELLSTNLNNKITDRLLIRHAKQTFNFAKKGKAPVFT